MLFACYIDSGRENEGEKEILDFMFYLVCSRFTHHNCKLITHEEFFADFEIDEIGQEIEFHRALCFTNVTLDSDFVKEMHILLNMFILYVTTNVPFQKQKFVKKWEWEKDLDFGDISSGVRAAEVHKSCIEINEAVHVVLALTDLSHPTGGDIFSSKLLAFLRKNRDYQETGIGFLFFDFYHNVYNAVIDKKIKKTTGCSLFGTNNPDTTARGNYRFIAKVKGILEQIIDDDSDSILHKTENSVVKKLEEMIICAQIVCLMQAYQLYKKQRTSELQKMIGELLSNLAVPASTHFDYTQLMKMYHKKIAKIAEYFQDDITKETVYVSDSKRERIVKNMMNKVIKNVKKR